MVMRLIQPGEKAHRPSIANRPHQDALTLSDYLVDGSDFTGFAKKSAFSGALNQWGPTKNIGAFAGRNYTFNGGTAVAVNGSTVFVAGGSQVVADNTVNYVERTYDGVVSINQVGFTPGRISMAKVTAAANAITVVEDWRPSFGPFPYFVQKAGEINVSDVRFPWGNVKRHGAVGDGVTDDAPRTRDAVTSALVLGTDIEFPPTPGSSYKFASQVLITAPILYRMAVWGYGATITTTGAFSGLAVTFGATSGGCSVYGLTVNHQNNALATYGFEFYRAAGCALYDCSVYAYNTNANYGAAILRNENPADDNTGCFWNTIKNLRVRKLSGADPGVISNGIILRGAANATWILESCIGAETCISVTHEAGFDVVANGLVIDGVAFEGFTKAVDVVSGPANTLQGARIVHCRCESGGTFVSLTGTAVQPSTPLWLEGNYLIPTVVTYLNNPNNLYVNCWDFPAAREISPKLFSPTAIEFHGLDALKQVLKLIPANNGSGLQLESLSGADLGMWVQRAGGGSSLIGSPNLTGMSRIQSIGSSAVEGKNLGGTAVFAAAAVKAVVFAVNEPDAGYRVVLGPEVNEKFWVSGRAVGGFNINAAAAVSGNCHWMISR